MHTRDNVRVKDGNLTKDQFPSERALGVHWNKEDSLCFKINLKQTKLTRRGLLSTLSSFYHPLGFASPFILKGRLILQDFCQEQLE